MSIKRKEEPKRVEVSAAKGRPMLSWVGKKPLRYVPALPAQHVESYDPSGDLAKIKPRTTWLDWPETYPKSGLLFHGDNKEVLAHLLANGFRRRVNFIYIDPPFDSGADYVRNVELRGAKGISQVNGEGYSLGEQIQYVDIWSNDNYLQFMYERLLLLKEILADTGVIVTHLDWHRHHLIRMVLDEVFGAKNFINHVVWHYFGFKRKTSGNYPRKHDDILIYAKSDGYTWNPQFRPHSEEYLSRWKKDENGRLYRDDVNPTGGGTRIIYLDETEGDLIDSVWDDIPPVNPVAKERMNFPTQKPEALIERLLATCTTPGDIVLDCFVGAGTTAAVAQKLGRRWIGCDINKGAIQITAKRLQKDIDEQLESGKVPSKKGVAGEPNPTQLSLCVFRVNDYDLQIQHNEAVRLACDYIGVETSRSDAYFDGTLGKELVKIIPFNHPLSPMDLEDLKRELEARKDEDRDIVLVCLGMELAAHAWVDEWNRLRKKGTAVPNRLRVIELRTDPAYSGFIKHDPATARVNIKRTKDRIVVKIEDFVSPTIIKRLEMERDLFQKKIKDWRSMVDCVMIDPNYDGTVFNVSFSDVPDKKDDLVTGEYELAVLDHEDKITVAVKIIDMLGEEVLVTKEV